eukprot:scaffold27433_cov107-Isochrysis_galbana.AAC.1
MKPSLSLSMINGNRKRTINAAQFLNTWDDIIRAIPAWCVSLMKKPSWQPSCHAPNNNSPRGNDPEFAIVSPEGL